MKPINFKESNVIYAKNQEEYLDLPAYAKNDSVGETITCWECSFIERIKIIFTGKIWLRLLTFNKPLQPVMMEINKPFVKNLSHK